MLKDYEIQGSYNNLIGQGISPERSINCFEYLDPRAKKLKTMIPTAGIATTNTNFPTVGGAFRRQFAFNGFMYNVIGTNIYQVNAANVAIQINKDKDGNTLPLTGTTGYVGVDANTFQIMWVDGTKGWVYDTTAKTYNQVTDTGFPTVPADVTTLDNFFVVIQGGTDTFQLSSFNQGMVWSGGELTVFTWSAPNILSMTSTANFATGVPFQVSGGVLPPGLLASTTYYAVRLSSTTISVALTYADAVHSPLPIVISLPTTGSGTNNATVQGNLQLARATTHPGNLVGCRTLHRRLFLFSQYFTEVWENLGQGANLPFRRNNSALIEFGAASVGSINTAFDKLFFHSQTRDGLGPVMMVEGVQAAPVTNKALDSQFAAYAAAPGVGVADATSILIKINGLEFYRLNFTLANATYVYNITMSSPEEPRWHEEQDLYGNRHIANTNVFFNGKNYYGSYKEPVMYTTDAGLTSNNGEVIPRIRIGRPFVPETYQRLRIDRFQLDLLQGNQTFPVVETTEIDLLTENGDDILTEAGQVIILESFLIQGFQLDLLDEDGDQLLTENGTVIILESSSGTEDLIARQPYVFFSYSKDGGQTYGNRLIADMGNVGQRTFRTVWRKLGTTPRGQAFVPKVEFYFDSPFVMLGAAWDYEVMPE